MALTIKWKKDSETQWTGDKGYTEYRILKKSQNRKYVFHCYKNEKYIGQGPDLETAQIQVTDWIKKHS